MLLSVVLFTMAAESLAQCGRSTSMKFSVSSWRNESGHRLVAADVQSDVTDKDSIFLTVELLSEKCGDSRAVILKTLGSTGHPEVSSTVAPVERTSVSSTTASTVLPLPGYHHIPGFGYYKLFPNQMTWEEGVEACRKEGTRMLLVESQEEIDILYEKARRSPWVGVHRESTSGPWINVLGQQMKWTDFFGWLPGEPTGRHHCVRIGAYGARKGTKNIACDDSNLVICEQTL